MLGLHGHIGRRPGLGAYDGRMSPPLAFATTLRCDAKRRVYLPLPADPGVRHLAGTVNGMGYRNAYLRWIDATKRSPELRAERIAVVVALLEGGVKQRP